MGLMTRWLAGDDGVVVASGRSALDDGGQAHTHHLEGEGQGEVQPGSADKQRRDDAAPPARAPCKARGPHARVAFRPGSSSSCGRFLLLRPARSIEGGRQ
jgi:hypothetical protein